jgi:hypothetical protein
MGVYGCGDSDHPTPELGLSKGKLCIDTWNEAISVASDLAKDSECRNKILKLFYYP